MSGISFNNIAKCKIKKKEKNEHFRMVKIVLNILFTTLLTFIQRIKVFIVLITHREEKKNEWKNCESPHLAFLPFFSLLFLLPYSVPYHMIHIIVSFHSIHRGTCAINVEVVLYYHESKKNKAAEQKNERENCNCNRSRFL